MSNYSKEFWEKIMTAWQPFSSSFLSHADAREITENIVGLFSLLSEWENKDGKKTEIKNQVWLQSKNIRFYIWGIK